METKNLVPWNWFNTSKANLVRVRDEGSWGKLDRDIERIYDDFVRDFGHFETVLPRLFRENSSGKFKVLPRMDLSEVDSKYIVEADLPGVKEEDLDISVSKDNILTITGTREAKDEKKDSNYHILERSYGSFERTLALPSNIDHDSINASFNDGVLAIEIKKKELTETGVKKINISKDG